MWRFNQSKLLLNLITRNFEGRLQETIRIMNPIIKITENLNQGKYWQQKICEKAYHTIQTELEPFYKSIQQNIFQSYKLSQSSPRINQVESSLRKYLHRIHQKFDIPIIHQLRDYLLNLPKKLNNNSMQELEFISKVITLKLKKSMKLQSFVKDQAYILMRDIRLKLHGQYKQQKNLEMMKQNSFKLMRLHKILTQKNGEENLENQFHWILQHGASCQKSNDIRGAEQYYREVLLRGHIKKQYRFLALKNLCRIYQKIRNISELQQLSNICKQLNIYQSQFKIIQVSLKNLLDKIDQPKQMVYPKIEFLITNKSKKQIQQ